VSSPSKLQRSLHPQFYRQLTVMHNCCIIEALADENGEIVLAHQGKGECIMTQTSVSLSPNELENLVRRVIREELIQLLRSPVRSILEDRTQDGPDDALQDNLLLGEALAVLREVGDKPEAWMTWEDFEAELDRAEAAGELPD
jgi:hypothetical protein